MSEELTVKRTLAALAIAILFSPWYAAAASDPNDRPGADDEMIAPSPIAMRVPPCNCSSGRAMLGALYVGFSALQVYDCTRRSPSSVTAEPNRTRWSAVS